MLKPSKCLPDSLQDSVEEMKNCYEGTPILHKKLLNNLVSQYLNFTQKHVTYTSKDLPIWSKHPCHLFLIKKKTHAKKVAEEVWVAIAQSSLEKNDNVPFT